MWQRRRRSSVLDRLPYERPYESFLNMARSADGRTLRQTLENERNPTRALRMLDTASVPAEALRAGAYNIPDHDALRRDLQALIEGEGRAGKPWLRRIGQWAMGVGAAVALTAGSLGAIEHSQREDSGAALAVYEQSYAHAQSEIERLERIVAENETVESGDTIWGMLAQTHRDAYGTEADDATLSAYMSKTIESLGSGAVDDFTDATQPPAQENPHHIEPGQRVPVEVVVADTIEDLSDQQAYAHAQIESRVTDENLIEAYPYQAAVAGAGVSLALGGALAFLAGRGPRSGSRRTPRNPRNGSIRDNQPRDIPRGAHPDPQRARESDEYRIQPAPGSAFPVRPADDSPERAHVLHGEAYRSINVTLPGPGEYEIKLSYEEPSKSSEPMEYAVRDSVVGEGDLERKVRDHPAPDSHRAYEHPSGSYVATRHEEGSIAADYLRMRNPTNGGARRSAERKAERLERFAKIYYGGDGERATSVAEAARETGVSTSTARKYVQDIARMAEESAQTS